MQLKMSGKELYKAVAAGIYNGEDKVQIIIGLPNATSTFYVNGYQFLVNCYTEAVSGTKFQDKLEFVKNERLKIIDSLQKEHLDFELDKTQIEALLKIIEIITVSSITFFDPIFCVIMINESAAIPVVRSIFGV